MSIEEKYYDDDQKKLETKTERYDNTMVRSRVEFYTDGKTVAAVYEGNRDGDGVVEEYRSKGIKRARYHIQFTGHRFSVRYSITSIRRGQPVSERRTVSSRRARRFLVMSRTSAPNPSRNPSTPSWRKIAR